MPLGPYCGALKVPKGRKRGTDDECIAMKQLRYYGIVKADPNKKSMAKVKDELEDAKFKLRDIQIFIKKAMEEAAYSDKILKSEKSSKVQLDRAKKDRPKIKAKLDKLISELAIRRKIVDDLKKELAK